MILLIPFVEDVPKTQSIAIDRGVPSPSPTVATAGVVRTIDRAHMYSATRLFKSNSNSYLYSYS